MKLVSVTPADDGVHKYAAKFENGRSKTTKFGAAGMDDYTKTHDKEQRARYLKRHSRNENWSDPTSAGSLSKHLLWGESTSMMANLRAFRNKFNL
jgi:hypothetical protein